MTETNKTLKSKRPPGRPKERISAKRRMLYLEDDVWRHLEFSSFIQKRSISKIVEEASIEYMKKFELLNTIFENPD